MLVSGEGRDARWEEERREERGGESEEAPLIRPLPPCDSILYKW
jgi:hypothetical protein